MKCFLTNEVEEHSHHEKTKQNKTSTQKQTKVEMGIEKNLGILIPLSILAGSSLRVSIIAKQHIKDIFVQINCILCGQMYVHIGDISPLSLLCAHTQILGSRSHMFLMGAPTHSTMLLNPQMHFSYKRGKM